MKSSPPCALVLATLVAMLPACGGPAREASPPPAATPASGPAVERTPAEVGASGASVPEAAEPPQEDGPLTPLGVPECDKFVDKYVVCVDRHVPADQRDRVMRELRVHRVRWLELEKTKDGKLAAALSCRSVAQRLKNDLIVDYGCEF